MTSTGTNLAARVLEWLRAGYPQGVPQQDYVVLLGLLRRKLTDTEVHQIATELAGLAEQGEVITTADVERLIGEATLDEAAPEGRPARLLPARRRRLAARRRPGPVAGSLLRRRGGANSTQPRRLCLSGSSSFTSDTEAGAS